MSQADCERFALVRDPGGITDIVSKLRSGEVSEVDVTKAFLDRILPSPSYVVNALSLTPSIYSVSCHGF